MQRTRTSVALGLALGAMLALAAPVLGSTPQTGSTPPAGSKPPAGSTLPAGSTPPAGSSPQTGKVPVQPPPVVLAPRAQLTVSPAQPTRDLRIDIAGSSFPSHRVGLILLRDTRLGRFRADRRGDWSARVRVPRGARISYHPLRITIAGYQVMSVEIRVSRRASNSSLAVLAGGEQVLLAPSRVAAGAALRLTGTDFGHRERVTLVLGSRRLMTVRAGAGGDLRAVVRIPRATRARRQALRMSFGSRRISFSLDVVRSRGGRGGPGHVTGPPPVVPGPVPPPAPPPPADPVVDAVGDMSCAPPVQVSSTTCQEQTVANAILADNPTALLDLGDNQYGNYFANPPVTELDGYQQAYDPSYGQLNSMVYPALGNAEYGRQYDQDTYHDPTASGFFTYFGQDTNVLARIQSTPGADTSHIQEGYYSFDLGAWHIIALNSNCPQVGSQGCAAGSPEERWLKADLAAHPGVCTLAYWHHPLFSSGNQGNQPYTYTTPPIDTHAFWNDLYAAHADIVLNGHADHHYERFVPQNPSGQADPTGMTEFIVATGGASHGTPPSSPGDQGTVVDSTINYTTFGYLHLMLHPAYYTWQFVGAQSAAGPPYFSDSGSAPCHWATGP